jgi:alkylation response protein AidB-like acyl-CoA dehydrogenase
VTMPPTTSLERTSSSSLVDIAEAAGRLDDPCALDLIGEARVLSVVGEHLNRRMATGLAAGKLDPQSPAIGRLFAGVAAARRATIAFELAGDVGGAWSDEDESPGTGFLVRQTGSIGGGTTEIARNVIAERVLRMPRELSPDRDTPFREVPRGRSRSG